MSVDISKKIADIQQISSDIAYLKQEFNGKLYGSCPNGDVTIEQMLAFAKEYDWLLEHIIKVAKKI